MGTRALIKTFEEATREYPTLTAEDESECVRMAKNGDEKAKEQLIVANWRYIYSVAKKNALKDCEVEELFQEGVCGLLYALKLYKEDCNVRFLTYASYWIKNYIGIAEKKNVSIVGIPRADIEKFRLCKKTQNALIELCGEDSSVSELSVATSIPEDTLRMLVKALKPVSLDVSYGKDEEETCTLQNTLVSKEESPDTVAVRSLDYARLEKALSHLCPREEAVIRKRYSIGTNDMPKTLEEIARCYNVTKERIRQIENKALKKLREDVDLLNLSCAFA